ncbi:MAG: ABC transporter permease [Prevotella sp.]|nr:ABC transporter permease [Bacteroides sp.]MCM1366220.1 ABC transporter permease [Prevotella sp.]MCM1436972.1 ABC transporter permease [Prevotella sp.]
MALSDKLLRKNMSAGRIGGFLLSNFIGLSIILVGLQFFIDARPIWQDEDSFIKKDYLVVNKKVTASNTLGSPSSFSKDEIADISAQPWVRSVGNFTAADFRVSARIERGDKGLSTFMFLESIPDNFIDVSTSGWRYEEDSPTVPVIISKDYLTLYNFGFASSAGMPQLTEGIMSSIPMTLTLTSDDGLRSISIPAKITGYSNRLNTIIVPQTFMDIMNGKLGSGEKKSPSRIIIDTNSPGDVAITQYLDKKGYEVAGDKSGTQASFLLKVITGIVLAIGVIITILSFFILLLSISLLMEKNRDKLHILLMLGYPLRKVGAPFRRVIFIAGTGSYLLALIFLFILRNNYIDTFKALGNSVGSVWIAPIVGLILTVLVILLNNIAVSRKVSGAFRV